MKLICETCTINRDVSGGKRAFQKTILAIGKGSERKGDETKIMLITTANKAGIKYSVLKNISKIFTRFLEEGKATISFIAPEHDVQIKSDKVQLTAFLKVLKLVLTGGAGEDRQSAQGTQSAPTNPFSPSAPLRLPCLTVGKKKASILDSPSVLSTKCVITNRKDYPTKGFSRLLVSLQISDVKLSRFDSQILLLQKLRSLNLSNNCIRTLPRALGQLRLCELDLSGNKLTDCTWDWLLETNIQSSLQSLNISNNGLSFLPVNVIYAGALVALMANENHIRKLPFAIWTMSRLRVLSLAKNQIDGVPETMERIRLERLDLSENNLSLDGSSGPFPGPTMQQRQPSTLFELTARTIINGKLPYATPGLIPFTVMDILRRVPLCGCGQPCFDSKVYHRTKLINGRCSCLVLNANHLLIADSVFCSDKCVRKASAQSLQVRGF